MQVLIHDADSLYLGLTKEVSANLVLHVGDAEFALSDAVTHGSSNLTHVYKWARGPVAGPTAMRLRQR